jgi:YidC/Oxa1 family membrane protein insertase
LKNQYLAQLYQVSNVNPLAGCFPALVQIPVFISLYRALQNLVAENKLDESFLWIPNLEGPSFMNPPSQSLDWLKSAFTGNPSYGWPATIAYLSIPMMLFISQTISQKILQPPRDPNKPPTEQEEVNKAVLNVLPLMVASFSLNVPAGLGVYWVVNNIVTTLVTLYIKSSVQNEPLPAEVDQLMAMIDSNIGASSKPQAKASGAYQELFGNQNNEPKRTSVGFGRGDPVINTTAEISSASDDESEAIKDAAKNSALEAAEVDAADPAGEDSKKKKAAKKEKRRR